VALPADARGEVDLASHALTVAKALRPDLDLAACRERLDAVVQRAASAAAGGGTARQRGRFIAARLFEREGFATGEPFAIDAVLDGKRGNCLGLSLLYLCAAGEAGLDARLVTAPKHVLVQIGRGEGRFYVETTKAGRIHDDLGYLNEHLGRRAMAEAGGIHLQPLTAAQAAGVLYAELGRALRDAGRYAEAIPHYRRAIEINPRHAEAHAGLGAALIGIGSNKAALAPLRKATTVNPQDPEAWCTLGVALRRLGRHAEACKRYSRAIELRPDYDRAWCNWGVALERMGQLAAACEKYARAAAINRRNADIWFNWGVALARLGRLREASASFERAVALRPDDPAAHRYWGTVLGKLGDHDAARERLERAADLERRRGSKENDQ
jgi:tetratricopeptide (TPR) repeat protein